MTSGRTMLLGLEENGSSVGSNRFSQDLTQIDSEETELNKKIIETEKELDYVEQVLRNYQGLKESLGEQLQNLITLRKNCLMKRDTLMATHNVFGSPTNDSTSIFGSNLLDSSTSIFLGKSRSFLKDPDDEIHSLNIDLSEMVSGLFRDSKISNGMSTETTNDFVEPLPLLSFSRVLSRDSCSTPSSAFGDGLGSSVIGTNSNGTAASSRSNSSLSPLGFRISRELDDVTSTKNNGNSVDFPALSTANKANSLSNMDSGSNNLNCYNRELSPTPASLISQLHSQTAAPQRSPLMAKPQNGTSPPTAPGQPRVMSYNAVLSLEASSTGYVYKSLADKTVVKYKFGNTKESCHYPGHGDKVKVLCIDQQNQHFVYTGCDDGKVRCFKADSGSLIADYQCEGCVISLEKAWDYLIVGTNKGWIYLLKNQLATLIASHRTFNWICSLKPLVHVQGKELKNKKTIVVLPMKHKPTLIDAIDGNVIREIGSAVIESKPCIQVNGSFIIIATVTEKSDPGKSVISVYDASNDWICLQQLTKDGIIAALRICGHELYVGVKFPSYGHIQCLKWANKSLSLKWIACVAYVNCLAVLPNDVVLNGGPDGSVYNTTPNLKGPFVCTNVKCKCKQPFARRKDLEFHYSKVTGTGLVPAAS
ncbi:hypothetical protein HDE_11459 [Halotydeus destructor]|nr:hypothetical protein HDE_11459 [Halotydeus destructor]